jgi:hypothetical protein
VIADSPSAPRIPPRLLPTLYVALAHVSLALAFAAVAYDPRGVAGFFYHSRMLAIVHLVTLGWITASILGALYIVAPVALRSWLPAGKVDYAAAALVWIGVIGMVGHFWIDEYNGMSWSGGTAGAGILLVGARAARPIRAAGVPLAIRAHIGLAFFNIAGAAVMGVLLGINKTAPFLPGLALSNVFAHAHLAAIGWSVMMVVGVAYRLLPMVLPSAMPQGARLWITAVLLETGACGLFITLLSGGTWTWLFALTTIAGVAAFFAQAGWMVRNRRPKPPAIPSPDPAVLHAGAAFVSLAAACALGFWLSIAAPSEWTLRAATAYGVFGLVGFLAQMVVAMQGRLLPLLAWYGATEGGRRPATSPHDMPWRGGQELVFVLWLFGVPALAGGLAFGAVPFVRAAAWSLLAATILDSAQVAIILGAMRPRSRRPS